MYHVTFQNSEIFFLNFKTYPAPKGFGWGMVAQYKRCCIEYLLKNVIYKDGLNNISHSHVLLELTLILLPLNLGGIVNHL